MRSSNLRPVLVTISKLRKTSAGRNLPQAQWSRFGDKQMREQPGVQWGGNGVVAVP